MITERPLYPSVEVEAYVATAAAYDIQNAALTAYFEGFEGGLGAWAAGTGATATRTSSWPGHTGTYSMLHGVTTSGTRVLSRTVLGLVVGRSYTFTAWLRSFSPATTVTWRIGVSGVSSTATTGAAVVDAWEKRTLTFTATATTHVLELTAVTPSTGNFGIWDDLTVVQDAWTEHVPAVYEWVPLLADATTLTIRRGGIRDGLGIKTDVGLCTFALKDAQDPLDGGLLKPGQPVRVAIGDDYTPAYTDHAYNQMFGISVDGWAFAAPATSIGRVSSQGHSGTYSLAVYGDSPTYGSKAVRTVTGLTVGRVYTLTAWAGRSNSGKSATVGVTGMGTSAVVNGWVNNTFSWKKCTYTFTATATSHELVLNGTYVGTGAAVGGVSPDYWDDVSLTWEVPEVDNRARLFTGRISDFGSMYVMDKSTGQSRAVVTVNVADAVKIHASTTRYGVDLGAATNETFEARIARLEGSANAPVEVPVVGAPREVYSF